LVDADSLVVPSSALQCMVERMTEMHLAANLAATNLAAISRPHARITIPGATECRKLVSYGYVTVTN
jgi:hypothetical protein